MAIKNIKVDEEACIGCGQCVSIAPIAFELKKDGKSYVKETWKQENEKNIQEAANNCPANAIDIEEE